MFSGFKVDEIQGKYQDSGRSAFILKMPNLVKTATEKNCMHCCFSPSMFLMCNFFSSSLDFTSDSRGLDISLSSSDTLAGLICCQLWRRRRGDQRWWEVKRMKGIQSIQNLHPYVVDVLRRCRRQPRSNFGEHMKSNFFFQFLVIFNTAGSLGWVNIAYMITLKTSFWFYFISFRWIWLSTQICKGSKKAWYIRNTLLHPCGWCMKCSFYNS